jgi:hypothetical protein
MQAELLQARGQECPRHTIYLTFSCKVSSGVSCCSIAAVLSTEAQSAHLYSASGAARNGAEPRQSLTIS